MTAETAAFVIWNDVDPANEAEYNAWYEAEHLPERVAVPGFLSGRRYRALGPGPRYLTVYDIESLATLESPAYLARLNDPTPGTRRIMPAFRDMHRSPCRVRARAGRGLGGVGVLLRIAPAATEADRLEAWLVDTVMPQLCDRPGVLSARFWQTEASVSRGATAESALRAGPDRTGDWMLFVDGTDQELLEQATLPIERRAPTSDAIGAPIAYRLLQALFA